MKDDEENKEAYKHAHKSAAPNVFRLEAHVYGVVQGVSFRAFASREAQRLGLTGTVSNSSSGSVLIIAEGDRAALQSLVSRLYQGPGEAEISRVETKWGQGLGKFNTFDIAYGE